MNKGFFVRFLGWVIFIISLCVVIAGLVASSNENFEIGLIIFFVITGGFGFLLTRYKRVKKANSPMPTAPKKPDSVKPADYPTTEKDDTGESVYHIDYVDSEGNESSRDIEILRFEESGDRLYIFAYCHSAKANRQFLVDRVSSISLWGQPIENPQQFLLNKYKNSTGYIAREALIEHSDEILALVFLAKADGKMLKNERNVIGRYIDIIAPDIDAEAVEKMLKNTTCELAEYNKILKRAKLWKPEIKDLIINAASQIIALKKQLDPMEKATFDKLKTALSEP